MTWTHFWDMNSGGGQKEAFRDCFIEAPEKEAISVFYARFGHNPERVTCTCCGPDYAIREAETLAEASAFQRGCRYDMERRRYVEEPLDKRYIPLEEYVKDASVMVIHASEIDGQERELYVPDEGYVWV